MHKRYIIIVDAENETTWEREVTEWSDARVQGYIEGLQPSIKEDERIEIQERAPVKVMKDFTITTFKLGRACVSHLATTQPRAAVEAYQRTLPDILYVIVEPTP